MAQEKWLVDEPKVLDIDGVRRLKIGLVAGQVDVVGHDEPGVRVEVHSVSGKELRIDLDGDTLEIDHPQLGWENWIEVFRWFRGQARADVSVLVPRNVLLRIGVVSASVLVTGMTEGATISTISGDVVTDRVRGDLQLNAVNAELTVRDHDGGVTAHTISGDITASGRIRRYASDGVSGEVFLDLAGVPDRVGVKTVSGDVTVRLDAVTAVRYRVNTVSGRMQLVDGQVSGIRGAYTGSSGPLDGSWMDFSANTVSGDVSVLHAVRA